MQAFNFALRQSAADSIDDNRSRYVPSSIYSGPGPAEEFPLPAQPAYPYNGINGANAGSSPHRVNGSDGVRSTYSNLRSNGYRQSASATRVRASGVLNTNDPIVMHLLAETALSDSHDFEILSFEELERLKKDRLVLRNRLEATKRKVALERKLRDAAQSLNRLYTKTKGSMDSNDTDAKGHIRNHVGSKSSDNEALSKATDEYRASSQRIEDFTHEVKTIEVRLEDTQRRILEHTAGILQLTYKGLKKNSRKNELPRSPESMKSHGHRSAPGMESGDDFDERSFYPVPDYVHEFSQSNSVTPVMPSSQNFNKQSQEMGEVAAQLQILSTRIHDMVRQVNPTEDVILPPEPVNQEQNASISQIQPQLSYISTSLDALVKAQQKTIEESGNVNARINKMLERTNSLSRSPHNDQDQPQGEDLASQLAFSTKVLEQLHTRVDTLVGQKDILTRQIQQQRELNTKSDAQRDAQILDLTEELEEAKKVQTMAEQEAQESQNQISMLIEQLDRARQDTMLMEQQRGMNENNALQAERDARKAAEKELLEDVAKKQQANVQLQADLSKVESDLELRSQQHIQQMNELLTAKEEASIEAKRHQAEAEKMLEQMAALQTELTIVKAELDGAYGTRAQRAADVSLNPAVQKEIDSLSSRNAQLQKELKDTIEDYEQMTKASIEFEKERDNLESSIDTLRGKCESLESQLSEEKLKWLGMKTQTTTETTSTTVLKNEFKKMMRDTRAENTKILRAEQEERRRLEAVIRSMRKEAGLSTPAKSMTGSQLSVEPTTPSATL